MSEEKKRKLEEYQINDGEANKNSLNLTKISVATSIRSCLIC